MFFWLRAVGCPLTKFWWTTRILAIFGDALNLKKVRDEEKREIQISGKNEGEDAIIYRTLRIDTFALESHGRWMSDAEKSHDEGFVGHDEENDRCRPIIQYELRAP